MEGTMPANQVGAQGPDFALPDTDGNIVRLSDYHGKANVVLVFNRSVY
jgi:peroxiredoxin